MRFRRRPRSERFTDTPRKRAAALRRQQQEREALPLLTIAIAETQPSIDVVMRRRANDWDWHEQRERDRLALAWRTIRAEIAALPLRQRRCIDRLARSYSGPLNPAAYAYFYREITGFHHPSAPCGMGGKPYRPSTAPLVLVPTSSPPQQHGCRYARASLRRPPSRPHWMTIVTQLPADIQRAFGLALVLWAMFGGFGTFRS